MTSTVAAVQRRFRRLLLASAKLLDYDHQVAVATKTGDRLYADYPGSDAAFESSGIR